MSTKDTWFHSECVSGEANHKMNYTFEIEVSERNKDASKIISMVSEDDLDEAPCYVHINSLSYDSGFSSSASDDRDDVADSKLGQHCDCHTSKSLVEESFDITENNTQNSLPTIGRHACCSKLTTSGMGVKHSGNIPLQTSTINKIIPTENHKSLFSNRIHRSYSLDNISGSKISSSNPDGFSRRQKTSNASPLVIFEAQAYPGISINRRLRSRDINNNESGHRDFNSYLKKMSPLKFQDCFQDQGLLSLIACITYTIALMIVFSVIGFVLDYIKSLIGSENLKDMRQNIAHSRRHRSAMSSG